jgi:cytochrome d ubiquinol oxidase subunit II
MTYLAVVFIGLSILLYVLLGGADFGAGIIEIFTGKKSVDTISNAIAPVWEANHIWLIVIIVVMFNAFPEVYSTITLNLHIPILLVLIGIIFRGTAFAFRYYDPYKDQSHAIYSFIFKSFSLLTPLFLGMTLGAIISGKITNNPSVSFATRYVAPWLNVFSISLGIFLVLLFAYLASVYLAGENNDKDRTGDYIKYSKILLIALVLFGGFVFLAAEIDGLHLFKQYLNSWVSIVCVVIATLMLPLFLFMLSKKITNLARFIAGTQTASIIIAWFGAQFPVLVKLKDAAPLTIYNCVAPEKTLMMMIVALIVGLALVIPLLIYLFKVFKFSKEKSFEGY